MGRKLEWKLYQTVNVTEQGGTQPPGTLTHDPTISVEENRFFFNRVPTSGLGVRENSSSDPFSWDPEPPLLSKRLQAKTMARSSPSPYLSVSQSHKQISIPLGCAFVGFRVTILSQQLSPSGCGVCCSQPPCSGSGKHGGRSLYLHIWILSSFLCSGSMSVFTHDSY